MGKFSFKRRLSGQLDSLTDDELISLCAAGNPQAFEVVFDRHVTIAFSLSYRMLGTRSAADDVIQEAFISVWRSASAYDPSRASVRTWILSIVHNRAIDELRKSSARREEMSEESEDRAGVTDFETVDDIVLIHDQARLIREALNALPPSQSQVINLAYFGGYTHVEIAELLSLPVGTVKGRMRLGLEKLTDRLRASGVSS